MIGTLKGARFSTRLAFFSSGFCMACWAPIVPVVKARLGIDEAALGLLLLCIGVGSIIAMPTAGMVVTRLGSKPIILGGGFATLAALPALTAVESPWSLGVCLLWFGAALSAMGVAMNVQAAEVERLMARPAMSGFHALFSLGGVAGSGGMTAMLSVGAAPLFATLGASGLTAIAMLLAWPYLLKSRPDAGAPIFVLPRGVVLLLALLASVLFLVEGAMLDWGALLLTGAALMPETQSGIGYMVFSVAMTIGRLAGDSIIARLGGRRVLVWGGLTMLSGMVVLIVAPVASVALCGFALIGAGASNLVPILFSQAGRQTTMSPSLAIASVTTLGYAGILCGPAAIGFVAQSTSLRFAFWILAALVALVPVMARRAVPADSSFAADESAMPCSSDIATVRANSLMDSH